MRAVEVFSVEPTAIQLVWRGLPAPEAVVKVGDRTFDIDARPLSWYPRRYLSGPGGPGALVVDGLEPATSYDVVLRVAGRRPAVVARARTAPVPPGRVLARFATVSDCHVGESRFGALTGLRDPAPAASGVDPYTVRALRAAIAESREWGSASLIARGDLTREGEEADAEEVSRVLSGSGCPVRCVLGNHDVDGPADVAGVLSAAGLEVATADNPVSVDLPGVRLVLGHTAVPGLHGGRVPERHAALLAGEAGGTSGPVVMVLHHPPRLGRLPSYYPPSISPGDTARLMARVGGVNPAVMALAGHTHRYRFYRVGPWPVAETGSTKDYPGGWTGFTLYEGGLAQTARRTTRPDVIAWTEMTRRALGGAWGRWSPGRLEDRCWYLEWAGLSRSAGKGR